MKEMKKNYEMPAAKAAEIRIESSFLASGPKRVVRENEDENEITEWTEE